MDISNYCTEIQILRGLLLIWGDVGWGLKQNGIKLFTFKTSYMTLNYKRRNLTRMQVHSRGGRQGGGTCLVIPGGCEVVPIRYLKQPLGYTLYIQHHHAYGMITEITIVCNGKEKEEPIEQGKKNEIREATICRYSTPSYSGDRDVHKRQNKYIKQIILPYPISSKMILKL